MDSTRRAILSAGVAAAAAAAVPRLFAQQTGNGGKFYERGPVRIYLRGGRFRLPSVAASGRRPEREGRLLHRQPAFQRNRGVQGRIPLYHGGSAQRPQRPIDWSCGGRPAMGILCRRSAGADGSSGHRQVHGDGLLHWRPLHLESSEARTESDCRSRGGAARGLAPGDARPEVPGAFWTTWGALLTAKRPEISLQTTDQFVTRMFETNPDFVFTVTRDFVRSCQNPVLILPDEVPAHPYAVAMECAMLAPKAEVSVFPWKEPKERIPLAVRQVRSFLRAHRPA